MASSTPSCCLCYSQGPFQTLYSKLQKEGTFAFLRCPSCKFIFREPRPTEEDLREYYLKSWGGAEEKNDFRERSLATADRFLGQLSRYSGPGRLLDVGCGPGFYLTAARQRGWEAFGVDIIPRPGKQEKDIPIFKGTLESAHFPSGFFDACWMVHTLGHLLNPIQVLREICRVLGPDGILIIAIPFFLRRGSGLKDQWSRLEEEKHLYLFSPQTVKRMVQSCGFELFYLDTQARFLTSDHLRKLHVPIDQGPVLSLARVGSRPLRRLGHFVGKFFPGPTIVLWARKKSLGIQK